MVIMGDGPLPKQYCDLAAIPATTAWALAPPVCPSSISMSQSSSSLSDSVSQAWDKLALGDVEIGVFPFFAIETRGGSGNRGHGGWLMGSVVCAPRFK